MNLGADIDLGAGVRLRTLIAGDVDLLVEATHAESAPALWAPRPRGAYSTRDAQAALRAWDPDTTHQASYGILEHDRMLGALGLMLDGPRSAELAYWVRPENRRQGLALRGLRALTPWAQVDLGLSRVWLEINPDNTPSLRVAVRAGYHFEQRMSHHCRAWTSEDPRDDTRHDCLIYTHNHDDSTTNPPEIEQPPRRA